MYGLIHTALRGMILEVSEVPSDAFLTMRSYDDEMTLALIGAASSVLELPADKCLEAFGHYWITNFAPQEYGALLDHTGDSPIEFLQNLDDLHDRISTSFTEFKPPSFRVVINDVRSATVRYVSSREGLTPFVLGILKGLGDRFNTKICIDSIIPLAAESGEQCDILISMVKIDE